MKKYIFEGFKIINYKGFKKNEAINIAPINILTGKNNAGKSSFIELINLISNSLSENGFEGLKFSKLEKLVSFNSAITRSSNSNEIILIFPTHIPLLGVDYSWNLELTFIKSKNNNLDGHLSKVACVRKQESFDADVDNVLFVMNIDEFNKNSYGSKSEIAETKILVNFPVILNIYFDEIEKAIKEYKEKDFEEVEVPEEFGGVALHEIQSPEEEQAMHEHYGEIFDLPTIKEYKDININSIEFSDRFHYTLETGSKVNRKSKNFYNDLIAHYFKNANTIAKLKEINPNITIMDYELIAKDQGAYIDNEIINELKEIEKSITISVPIKEGQYHYSKNYDSKTILFHFCRLLASTIEKSDLINKTNLKLDFLSLEKINKEIYTPLVDLIGQFIYPLHNYIEQFENLETIDLTIDENLSSILKTIYSQNIHIDSIENTFLTYWLQEFGYEESYKLTEANNEITLTFGGQKMNSFGRGLNSLIKILFGITSQAHKNLSLDSHRDDDDDEPIINPHYNTSILILIEPESNLHPDLQSKLADLMVDAAYKFNIKFIVESHSEYLIRKLQYWTAKGKASPKDVIINYLEKNKDQKGIDINQITIDEKGNLSDDLGEGFIDHAPKLMLDLLNLKKKNNLN